MALAAEGARLAICARDSRALQQTADEIRHATNAHVTAIPADVSRPADVQRLVGSAVRTLGGLDILVTNTGGPKSAPFEALSDDDWIASIDSLLMSVVRLTQAAIPHMRARGAGRIINIPSISVKQPIEGLVLSNALRAAVTGIAKTLAIELAPDNILVNCIAPGYTATDRMVELAETVAAREGTTPDVVQRRTETKIPLGRLGAPEEFGAAVTFLASARASYITGVTLQVDGGFIRGLL